MTRPRDEAPPLPELAALPREAEASELEEERTVRALRAQGLLGAARRRPRRRPLRLARQLAAALALFLGGVALGEHLARRPGAAAAGGAAPDDAVLAIQRTGSSFVRAISRVPAPPAADPGAVAAAQEVARSTLRAAEAVLNRNPPPSAPRGGSHVVWF